MHHRLSKMFCKSIENKPGCIQAALSVLGDKWSPLLIGHLTSGPRTFGELETFLGSISPRTLSARLDRLQSMGVITRIKYNDHPPRYKYEITEKGSDLMHVLKGMAAWGEKYPEQQV